MGSLSRLNRCERFLEEFRQDALLRFGWKECPAVASNDLGIDYDAECVKFYLTLEWNEREEEVCLDMILYGPEWEDEEVVRATADYFELDSSLVVERLKKAKLIAASYKVKVSP